MRGGALTVALLDEYSPPAITVDPVVHVRAGDASGRMAAHGSESGRTLVCRETRREHSRACREGGDGQHGEQERERVGRAYHR